jgi:ribosomal protein S18 acetylase RimI-like enzyme
MLIRAARATDLPAVYAGELDYIQEIEPQEEDRWRAGTHRHLRQWTENLERMFIATSHEKAVGYCFWEEGDHTAVLASIYVSPDRRREGLGKTLLATFLADAQAKGFTNIVLGVKADNPARRLYEASGFVHSHDENGYRHYLFRPAS